MSRPPLHGATKHDRENARKARKEAKAEKLAARRAARLQGVEISSLPENYQGVARTLATGEEAKA